MTNDNLVYGILYQISNNTFCDNVRILTVLSGSSPASVQLESQKFLPTEVTSTTIREKIKRNVQINPMLLK